MARRKRKSHRRRAHTRRRRRAVMANPRRRHVRHRKVTHRRRARRNPFPSARGIVGVMKEGAVSAAQAVVGKAVTRIVAARIPFPNIGGAYADPIKQIVVGTAVGLGARKVLGPKFAANVLIGAYMGPIETIVRQLNIPVLSPALGAYVQPIPAARRIGAYVQPRLGAVETMAPMADMDQYGSTMMPGFGF